MFVAFINFQEAYGRIKKDELYKSITELGRKGKLLRLPKTTLEKRTSGLKVDRQQTQKFELINGLI